MVFAASRIGNNYPPSLESIIQLNDIIMTFKFAMKLYTWRWTATVHNNGEYGHIVLRIRLREKTMALADIHLWHALKSQYILRHVATGVPLQ